MSEFDLKKALEHVQLKWKESVVQALSNYIAVPNQARARVPIAY